MPFWNSFQAGPNVTKWSCSCSNATVFIPCLQCRCRVQYQLLFIVKVNVCVREMEEQSPFYLHLSVKTRLLSDLRDWHESHVTPVSLSVCSLQLFTHKQQLNQIYDHITLLLTCRKQFRRNHSLIINIQRCSSQNHISHSALQWAYALLDSLATDCCCVVMRTRCRVYTLMCVCPGKVIRCCTSHLEIMQSPWLHQESWLNETVSDRLSRQDRNSQSMWSLFV